MLGVVGQSLPDLVRVVLFGQGAGRADHDALAAGDAGHIVQLLFERGADMGVDAAVVGADHRHELLAAGRDAAAAEDALVVVPHQMGGRGVQLIVGLEAVVFTGIFHAVVLAHLLQLAVA